MKIKAICVIFKSRADRNGNSYYAFRYISTRNGKKVEGRDCGGVSNVTGALFDIFGDSNSFFYTIHEMGYRAFCETVKDFPYAGVSIADFIIQNITGLKTLKYIIKKRPNLKYDILAFASILNKRALKITCSKNHELEFRATPKEASDIEIECGNVIQYTRVTRVTSV